MFTVAFDAGTSGSKAIASYRSNEFPFDRVERDFLVDPSVRLLTEPTYQDLLESAREQEGISANLVSDVAEYCRTLPGVTLAPGHQQVGAVPHG
jgi:hypothetical protein